MLDAVADYCRSSGCSLLEVLYAINEVVPEGKRYYTTDSLIDMYNVQLEILAEKDDAAEEEDAEK